MWYRKTRLPIRGQSPRTGIYIIHICIYTQMNNETSFCGLQFPSVPVVVVLLLHVLGQNKHMDKEKKVEKSCICLSSRKFQKNQWNNDLWFVLSISPPCGRTVNACSRILGFWSQFDIVNIKLLSVPKHLFNFFTHIPDQIWFSLADVFKD